MVMVMVTQALVLSVKPASMSVTLVIVAIVPAVEAVSGGTSIATAGAVEDGPAREKASVAATAASLMSLALAAVAVAMSLMSMVLPVEPASTLVTSATVPAVQYDFSRLTPNMRA